MRRKNLYREGSINSIRHRDAGRRERACRCSTGASKRRRCGSRPSRTTRTRANGAASAIASGIKNVGYSFGFPEQATATVELVVLDGVRAARVSIGAADVGQGAHLILRQIAAETLSLPLER